jgi:hypothetical protein
MQVTTVDLPTPSPADSATFALAIAIGRKKKSFVAKKRNAFAHSREENPASTIGSATVLKKRDDAAFCLL